MGSFRSLLVFLIFPQLSLADDKNTDKNGWTCGADGFWADATGKPSTFPCGGGKKGTSCNSTHMTADASIAAVKDLSKTCIAHSSQPHGRCWWTHVPSAVASATDGRKVPLVIDMHGGGGCAAHEVGMGVGSGFKELADTEAAKAGGGMIVVFPQGGSIDAQKTGIWASCGSDCLTAKGQAAKSAKGGQMADWDDIGFLEQLIANMVKSSPHKGKIDAERIYMTGFSNGCMMAHRFAMERSKMVAALGCHGGELNMVGTNVKTEMDSEKATHNIQPMPCYLTMGKNDNFLANTMIDWRTWSYWNGCTSEATTSLTSDLVEHVATSCATYTPALETAVLEIKGVGHKPDSRTAGKIWNFVSKYKRAGALGAIPELMMQTSAAARGKVCAVVFLHMIRGVACVALALGAS